MRHETRLKLDRELRLRQLKFAGIGLAILAAVVGGFLLVDLDSHETKTRVAGTIESVATPAQKGALDGLEVGVKLEDGRHVRVLAMKSRDPHVGDRIEVTEHHHLTGRTTFTFR
ncbi:MAG: hypothetical protein JNM89_08290 [Hyphomicrobiaceae bacterium]|nr:hypothetical protein [Hyphomicrobiaceae bacterium]